MGDRDNLLERVREAGEQSWPELAVNDDELLPLIDAVVASDDVEPTHPADLYLAAACIVGSAQAADVFERELIPVVERAVRKVNNSQSLLDDVKQHVRTLALVTAPGRRAALLSYRGSGALASWIRVVAVREAYRLLRVSGAQSANSDDAIFAVLSEAPDPELAMMKSTYRDELRAAFRSAMEELPRRERAALRFSVIDGLSIDAIGKMYGVHRATAARWLTRARDMLAAKTRAAMMTSLGVPRAELDSILRLLHSRLDNSIASVLGARTKQGG